VLLCCCLSLGILLCTVLCCPVIVYVCSIVLDEHTVITETHGVAILYTSRKPPLSLIGPLSDRSPAFLPPYSLDITRTGEFFVSGSGDKTLRVWSYDEGEGR
jgi:WD40 repeat protein